MAQHDSEPEPVPQDAADADDYLAGRITIAEYARRVEERYLPTVQLSGFEDPVVVYDAMWDAGISVFGSYIWFLDRCKEGLEAAERWWALALDVKDRRAAVDANDLGVQRCVITGFIAQEKALRGLVRPWPLRCHVAARVLGVRLGRATPWGARRPGVTARGPDPTTLAPQAMPPVQGGLRAARHGCRLLAPVLWPY